MKGLTVPDPQQIALWSPFIHHIHSRYPIFPSILLSRTIKKIISSSQVTSASSVINPPIHDIESTDLTYVHTLASWVVWIIDRWGDDPYADCEPEDVIKELLFSLGRGINRTYVIHADRTINYVLRPCLILSLQCRFVTGGFV